MRRSLCALFCRHCACIANNQQGDFEAVAYQAFSVARDSSQPTSTLRDWSLSEDTRAVEAELRERRLFIARDATKPWLWLFTPTTVAEAGAQPAGLPDVDGYLLQRTCLRILPEHVERLTSARRTSWSNQSIRTCTSSFVRPLPHRCVLRRLGRRTEQSRR